MSDVDELRHLSRRTAQSEMPTEPSEVAALNGEVYFDLTPGHLVTTALDSGEFEDVDEVLDFFGLEMSDLRRNEAYEKWEIDQFEDRIINDAQDRLQPAIDAIFENWAERVIADQTLPDDEAGRTIAELQRRTKADPSPSSEEFAENIEHNYDDHEYNELYLQSQAKRLVYLLERDGFAISAEDVIESFVANGLDKMRYQFDYPEESTRDRGQGWRPEEFREHLYKIVLDNIRGGVGTVAAVGLQNDVIAKPSLNVPSVGPNHHEAKLGDLDTFDYFVRDGYPVYLSAEDLRLFASHYAPPVDISPAVSNDARYQRLMSLVKNTPERIEQVRGRVGWLQGRDGHEQSAAK